MASGHPRRVSAAPSPASKEVPPAPPLPPPQRYSQQAKSAISRVFGIGATKAQPHDGRPTSIVTRPTTLSFSNATAEHRTGLRINALSINESGTHALVAGKDIFKTLRVEGDSCTEDANIRSAIRSYNASLSEAGTSISKESVDIHDVAWAKGTSGNLIAAATYNGPIVLYDLNRLGIEIARLFDHKRQVHRVTFNPHAGYYMLSASQDGTVRMWDIRDCQRNVATFTSRVHTPQQADGIRDVKWSPTNGTEFAIGTDGGWIQKWDTQMMRVAKVRTAAHSSACNTIDWHPDGKHILSAGYDKFVKVWNVTGEGSRRKPVHEIKVPFALRNARWRPAFQSMLHGDTGVRQCTQLVTSYDKHNPVLHVWDLRRPLMPFRELECNSTSPTDLLWHSQDLLWTVGREGVFTQTDVSFATKTIDRRNVQAFAISPQGEIKIATQTRRPKPELPRMSPVLDRPRRQTTDGTLMNAGPIRIVRSAGDDTLDDNFLSVVLKMRKRESAPPFDARPLEETPPSGDVNRWRVLPLDSKTERFRAARPPQTTSRGALPGSGNPLLFQYFAHKYRFRPNSHPPSLDAFLKIQEVFDHNAEFAKLASMYRLAQSWRIMGQLVQKNMNQRAERNRDLRLHGGGSRCVSADDRAQLALMVKEMIDSQAARASAPPTPLAVPFNKRDGSSRGSSSAMPTPRVHPSGNHQSNGTTRHEPLLDIDKDNDYRLPPRVVETADLTSPRLFGEVKMDGGEIPVEEEQSMSVRLRRARDGKLNDVQSESGPSVQTPPPLVKHDSDDSFGVFPLSTSRNPSLPLSTESSQRRLMDMVSTNLKQMELDPRYASSPRDGFAYDSRLDADLEHSSPERFTDQALDSLPRIDTTSASHEDHHHEPVAAIERPKSRQEVDRDIQTLVKNNQESFTSDTDIDMKNQLSAIESDSSAERPTDDLPLSANPENGRFRDVREENGSLVSTSEYKKGDAVAHDGQINDVVQHITVEDFLAQPSPSGDNTLTELFPLLDVLNQLTAYHTNNLSDAQSITAFLLLVMPLLPETAPLNLSATHATISHYIEHFTDLSLSDTTISTYLTTSISHLLLAGLQPLMVESILTTYHDQLQSRSLPVHAALLRRLSYPTFPSVYDVALKDNLLSFRCSSCDKALIISSPALSKCESCQARPPQCPICWLPESPYSLHTGRRKRSKGANDSPTDSNTRLLPDHEEEPPIARTASAPAHHIHPPSLFTSCLTCNHAAHAACLSTWHGLDALPSGMPSPALGSARGRNAGESDGLCPVAGCGCPCISEPVLRFGDVKYGPPSAGALLTPTLGQGYPSSSAAAAAGARRSVVEDDVKVVDSRAVARARAQLSGQGSGLGLGGGRFSGASGGSGGSGASSTAGIGTGVRSWESLR